MLSAPTRTTFARPRWLYSRPVYHPGWFATAYRTVPISPTSATAVLCAKDDFVSTIRNRFPVVNGSPYAVLPPPPQQWTLLWLELQLSFSVCSQCLALKLPNHTPYLYSNSLRLPSDIEILANCASLTKANPKNKPAAMKHARYSSLDNNFHWHRGRLNLREQVYTVMYVLDFVLVCLYLLSLELYSFSRDVVNFHCYSSNMQHTAL